jgi:hypothetical protein
MSQRLLARTRILSGAAFGLAAALALAGAASPGIGGDPAARASEAGPAGIAYKTIFQAPDASRAQDLVIENHAIALVNATPSGERIRFAIRDFNRPPVVDALIKAQGRGVDVRGVIDGGERSRAPLVPLVAALGSKLVFCGSDIGFALNSCLANDPKYSDDGKSLQHNKFMTFSRLSDGRSNVVLQTSMNFFGPSQLTYYNDALEIAGDVKLHAAYEHYVADMMRQGDLRTNDRYTDFTTSGDDGRNTMFPSPRPQPDPDTNDTIVDRLDEIDCAGGGTVRAANMAFRSERAAIMRKLVKLENQGCDIEVVLTNGDGDVISGLVSGGIEVIPFLWRAVGTLPQVRIHNKFWLVDAKSTTTGRRTKIAYVGSSNWRGDQQYSDDMLLRVVEDGVYDAYSAYWRLIKERAFTDVPLTTTDAVKPSSALTASPAPTTAGWHRDDVTLRIAASDGHGPGLSSGLARVHIELSGAQNSSAAVVPPDPRLPAVAEILVSAEGTTTVTYSAVDNAGNPEVARTAVIRIDKTPPSIAVSGRLAGDCELWPPNGRMRSVGTISATDALSGLDTLVVEATSEGTSDGTQVVMNSATAFVTLRAAKAPHGSSRTYTVSGVAQDRAGNVAASTVECVVPHSQGNAG